ncbi:MAG: small multidrug export protein [Ruminococcaceae bacterium]|nr:small multidrug export protein [Oscillospiraceae bacterium]
MSEWITGYFAGFNSELAVFIVSMLPVVELRGAIPFGVGLGMDWRAVFLISVIGNMIPVPFIILFFRPILEYMKKTRMFSKFANWLHRRSERKIGDVTKYKMLGLFLLVAIPLPGTGAWTGAAIAALMGLRLKQALPSIVLGVVAAGILMMGISYGFGNLLIHFLG